MALLWLTFLLVFYVTSSNGLSQCPAQSCAQNALVFPPSDGNQVAVNVNDPTTDPVTASDRYLYIAGVFPLHHRGPDGYNTCGDINPIQVLRMHAFQWAVTTASKRLASAPKVNFRGIVIDSCSNVFQLVTDVSSVERCRSSISFENMEIDRRFIAAYLDSHSSLPESDENRLERTLGSFAKPVLRLSSDNGLSQIFYRSFPVEKQLEGLLNIISNDHDQTYAMVLHSDAEYYNHLYEKFNDLIPEDTVCVPYSGKLTKNTDIVDVVNEIRANKELRFLVLLLTDADMERMLREMEKGDGSDSIAFNVILLVPDLSPGYKQLLYRSRLNSVLLDYSTPHPPLTDSFLEEYRLKKPNSSIESSKYFNEFWKKRFDCSNLTTCDGNVLSTHDVQVNVEDVVYAVDALIDGLEKARSEICGGNTVCDEIGNWDNSTVREMVHRLAKPYGGKQAFKSNENSLNSEYRVLQLIPSAIFAERQYVEVGTINGNGSYKPKDKGVQQFDDQGEATVPIPTCLKSHCRTVCFRTSTTVPDTGKSTGTQGDEMYETYENDPIMLLIPFGYEMSGSVVRQNMSIASYNNRYSMFGQSWAIAIAVCSGVGVIVVIIFEIAIMCRASKASHDDKSSKETPQVYMKFRTLFLSQTLLLGILLSYLTLLAFLFVPSAITCGIIRFCVGFCYAMCYSVLIVKLLVLIKSRTSDQYLPSEENSPNYLKGSYQIVIFIAALAVQVAIAAQWLIREPPDAVRVKSYAGEPVWICNHYTWAAGSNFWDMMTFVRSNTINHIITLTYISVLIVIALILAIKAQDIVTNLKESRFIVFAILFSIPIWVAWQLLAALIHIYNHDEAHEIADASTAFGLFIIATLLLFTMFLPKVRQLTSAGVEGVYLEDDKEIKYYDSNSMHSRDLPNGSYFIADGSMVDGSMGTLTRPGYMETSYSTPLPAYDTVRSGYDRSILDRSGYDRSMHDRSMHDRSMHDRSMHNRSYDPYDRSLQRSGRSTPERNRQGHGLSSVSFSRPNEAPHIRYSETHSSYENDPHALHAKHPGAQKAAEMSNSSPDLLGTSTYPSLPRSTTSRASRTTEGSVNGGFGLNKSRTLQLSHDLTGRRVNSTMYPTYGASEAGSSGTGGHKNKSLNYGKRSRSVDGLTM